MTRAGTGPRGGEAPAAGPTGRGAARFDRTRGDHRAEIAQDYVELIADLIEATGEARAIDLAGRLGVSCPTVTATVARLGREGLVRSERYRAIHLTDAGWALARECRRRHRVVLDLLRALGVPEDAALSDAEGIEHHVSEATLAAFARFVAARGGGGGGPGGEGGGR